MVFRRMELSDKAEMRAFFKDMGEVSALFFNDGQRNENRLMAFFRGEGRDHEYSVMVDGEKIVGYSFVWDMDKFIPSFGICVRDGYKGKHIGTAMLNATITDLKARGYGGLMLTTAFNNRSAQALYEKCGFRKMGTSNYNEILYLNNFRKE